MSKHTPGPWDNDAIYSLLRFGSKYYGPWDDEIDENKWMPDENDADLIAAAPELLAVLDYALAVADEGLRLGPEWREKTRAVIVKAKGETE